MSFCADRVLPLRRPPLGSEGLLVHPRTAAITAGPDECLELATAARAAGLRAELKVGDEARTWRANVPVYDWQDRPFMALGGADDATGRGDADGPLRG